MNIKFLHEGKILSAELMYDFERNPDIVLVKLQKVDDDLHSIIPLYFNHGKWVSDEFNDLYPETMNNLLSMVTIALKVKPGIDTIFK